MNQASAMGMDKYSLARRWAMAIVVLLVMVAAFSNQFKVPQLFGVLGPVFHFDTVSSGYMMSAFSLMGLIVAYPAAPIIGRLGIKWTLLITSIGVAGGSLIGAFAGTSAAVILVSRFIEGAGVGLLSVVAPNALAVIIPKNRHGLVFGLQGIAFPAGTIIGMNCSVAINAAAGWQAVWVAGAAFAFVTLLLTVFVFKLPPEIDKAQKAKADPEMAKRFADIKPDWKSIIAVSVAFLCWNILWAAAFSNYYGTFLQGALGLARSDASLITTMPSIVMLIMGPISGIISDKLGTRKWLIVFALVGSAIMFAFGWSTSLTVVWVFVVIQGIIAPFATTGTMSIGPALAKRPDKIGLAMANISFFKNIAMVFGPTVFSLIAVTLGSDAQPAFAQAVQFFVVPVAIIGALIMIFFVKEERPPKGEKAVPKADVTQEGTATH